MAQAILLQDVDTLGERGHVVDVAPGYLRNFLIPRKLAQPATAGALEEAKRRMEAAEKAEAVRAARESEAAGGLSQKGGWSPPNAGEGGETFCAPGAQKKTDPPRRGPGPR